MNNEKIDTITYRGFDIDIYPDWYSDISPDEQGDDDLFLVAYHRDFTITRDRIITKDQAVDIFSNENEQDTKDILKKYHCFGLEAYIHGRVHLSLSYEGNYPDRGWDVSQLGLVLVAKTIHRTRKKAKETAQSLLNEWNDVLSGNVYGFRVEKTGDSCWGFIGDYETSGLLDNAKSNIDWHIKNTTKQHNDKLKTQIKKNVPLEYREALEL